MSAVRSWTELQDGVSVLVRSGEGIVTAVSVTANADRDLVEVLCQSTRQLTRQPRSIRVTLRALCPADSHLAQIARRFEGTDEPITWMVEWHRRPGIPEDIPIENLQQSTDTTPLLVALSPVRDGVVTSLEQEL